MPRARSSCLTIVSACLAVSGCGGLVPDGEPGARPPASGTASASRQRPPIGSSSQPSAGQNSASPACLADLGASGARFSPLPDNYGARGCNQLGTVQLSTVAGDYSQFGISNIGPLKCSVAQTFSGWARFGVDRAARQILGSPIARIETMGSYACRNVAGTSRRSAHARAAAIDVSGFVLEDGRRIVLKSDWNGGTAAEREFLRVVHRSACKRFGTVLGPDYNRAHADHFHLEGSGGKFCR